MRDFETIARQYGLKKFLDSPYGTLYFVPPAPGKPQLMVRHFDGAWSPAMIPACVDLLHAIQQWIETHTDLAALVRVEQPQEVGTDFVARKHHFYHVSLESYLNGKIDPPDALRLLQERLIPLLDTPADEREAVIHAVLRRSLLEPNDKTFWSPEERFVMVEPVIRSDLLDRWIKLSQPT